MKNMLKKLACLSLALVLVFALAACGSSKTEETSASSKASSAASAASEASSTSTEPTAEPTEEPASEVSAESTETSSADEPETLEVDKDLQVNVMVLNGTTGFGMADLINSAANGAAALNYNFSVETDASNITAALINGSVDIAALPTNAASVVYNKTQGAVQALAINTLGVLYVVTTDGSTVSSLADLEGMTVYAPAQNPTFIFSSLCEANGVNVTVDNTYAQPSDLMTAVSEGQVAVAVLPEPMVTMAKASNENVQVAIDLTKEWDAVHPAGSLVQGCVVVRTEFAAEHPAEVKMFLEEYEASIASINSGNDNVAEIIESSGVFAKGQVAAKAIPNCNIVFIAGEEMKTAFSEFLNIMAEVAPDSIGGAVPGDDFYYIAE